MSARQRVRLRPGEAIEVVLTDTSGESAGHVEILWRDKNALDDEIPTEGRELQIDSWPLGGLVGDVVMRSH